MPIPDKSDFSKFLFLIVDEDPKYRKMIHEFLHIHGFENRIDAADGTTAWNKLKRYDVNFVICNFQLSQMNGLALLKIMMLDESLCTIPFLMTSNNAEKSTVIAAAKAGVSGFIIKPFNDEKLMEKIRGILAKETDSVQDEIKRLFLLGKQLVDEGNLEKALETYNRIIALNEEAEAYLQIGYINESQGNLTAAAAAFRKASQLNTTFVKAFEALGKLYKKTGNVEESEKCFEKAGDLYLKKEMLEEAEEVYREANALNPQNINIFNSLGIVYRRRGLYIDAINEYKKALKITPYDEHIHFNIARAYLEAKNVEEAKEHLQKSLGINPGFKEAVTLLKAISIGFSKG